MLHAVIKSRSLNPEKRSRQTRIIHKGEGFTDRRSKTVQKDRIEHSAQTSIPEDSFDSSQYCCSVRPKFNAPIVNCWIREMRHSRFISGKPDNCGFQSLQSSKKRGLQTNRL